MLRLGELLVAAGLLTVEQVERALRAQVLWGGRLGTNIVELHLLELDPLSRALGRQLHLPAALARHFEKADPALQRLLSPDFAERFSCVPLLRMGPEGHVVVASIAPLLPRQLAIVADELGVEVHRLVPAIAAELRVRYQLERVYNIRRTARYLRARGKSIPPFPAFEILPVQAEPEGPPSLPVSTREMAVFRPALVPDLPSPTGSAQPAAPVTAPPVPAIVLELDPEESSPADSWPTEPWPTVAEAAPTPRDGQDTLDLVALEGDDLLAIEVVPPGILPDNLDDLNRAITLDDGDVVSDDPGDVADADSAPGRAGSDAGALRDSAGRERRQYVRTLADAPTPDAESQTTIGRIAIRRLPVGVVVPVTGTTLGEATRAIRRSTGRDRVAELVMDTLERFAPACEAAILLVIRGATAIGWKGFVRGGGSLGELAVPLEDGGLVPRAVELNVTLRKAYAELDPIDRLLLGSLGRREGDLVIVPISISDQVMCVIAVATGLDAPIASAEPIAAAAGAAFARLMRDASR